MKRDYLENKVFLVTGAGSGLGYETTRLLLQNHAVVFAMVRKPNAMDSLLSEFKGSLYLFKGDVSEEKDCEKFISTAIKKMKAVHGVIHCAGVGIRSYAKDIKHEVFHNIMDTNFYSMVYLYQAAREHLERTQGHIVAVSSVQGLIAVPYRSAYSASKHALNAFINSIRAEDKRIHFLCVNYGYIKTNFSYHALDGSGKKFGKNSSGQMKGVDVTRAARLLIDAMIKRKREISPTGFREKFALQVHRFFPYCYYRLIFRYVKPD